ncbi:GNAT family N-acetyltransferase [Cytobacillus dafuensis]|uniref:GNAT family N-acetyltransferase n=1 Tax=Cytobacillus dafuensis TaxID=1742359 RepID=A0A5B8Z0E1_CYTDA|nr:GNAT family N-acetyltransferase [Cytobacillus dafuensis]QED46187.1 GNAT family N-acetyltransferase [Cytobacillus dafuensis]
MLIRKAGITDAEGIATVHVDCWRTTYKDIISEEFLRNLSYDQRTKLWTNNISREDSSVFVAEDEKGKIIGFTSGSGVKPREYQEFDGDVTSIYILEKCQGQGIGRELLSRLFEEFRSLGFRSSIVKVLEENNSRRFYEAMGARLVESTMVKIADDQLTLLVYGWEDIRI